MFDVIEPQSRGHRERLPQFVFYALRICVGRHCYQPDDLVAVARPRNGERGAFEPGNLPHQAFHMRRVNEYFPNLDGGTHPALQRRDAADATVWRRLISIAIETSPVPKRIIGQPRASVVTTISPGSPCGTGAPVSGSHIWT